MITTITNSFVESFVTCKQKAYLEIVDRIAVPTHFELQLETIATHMRDAFRQSVKNQTISAYDISQIEVKDFSDLSKPVFLVCPSFFAQNRYTLTIDAVAIHPPPINARQLTCIPITISPNHKISKNDRISLCIKTLLLLERNANLQAQHGRIIFGREGTVSKFSLQPLMREAREAVRQMNQLAENTQQPPYYKNNHCKICRFERRCHDKFVEKDDLSLLGSIPPKQVERLNNRGIFTVTQLSYTFRPKQ